MHKRLLILGGTSEARNLATQTIAYFKDNLSVLTSLAGVTNNPNNILGLVRRGGFGGAEGLEKFLIDQKIDLLVDATHPFATRISKNAVKACNSYKIQRLILKRPAWVPIHGDNWYKANDLRQAASILPLYGKVCFLTVGKQSISAFSQVSSVNFIVRLMETPNCPLSLNKHEIIIARPPYQLDQDILLLENKKIDILVAKNSGGNDTYSKIVAARRLGLPVVMVSRPTSPPGKIVESVSDALSWLESKICT